MKQTNPFIRVMDKITFILSRIASVLMIITFLMITVNVIGRKILNMPVRGSVELVEYLMLIAMSMAVSRTGFEDRHISVTFVQELLPKKARSVVKSICELSGGLIFGSLVIKFARSIPAAIDAGRPGNAETVRRYSVRTTPAVILVKNGSFRQLTPNEGEDLGAALMRTVDSLP